MIGAPLSGFHVYRARHQFAAAWRTKEGKEAGKPIDSALRDDKKSVLAR